MAPKIEKPIPLGDLILKRDVDGDERLKVEIDEVEAKEKPGVRLVPDEIRERLTKMGIRLTAQTEARGLPIGKLEKFTRHLDKAKEYAVQLEDLKSKEEIQKAKEATDGQFDVDERIVDNLVKNSKIEALGTYLEGLKKEEREIDEKLQQGGVKSIDKQELKGRLSVVRYDIFGLEKERSDLIASIDLTEKPRLDIETRKLHGRLITKGLVGTASPADLLKLNCKISKP